MTFGGAIFTLVFAGLVVAIIVTYNKLVGLRQRSAEAWSDIDVQLKRRTDLVPNLVETVKGYAEHERETFEEVTKARSALEQAGNVQDSAAANNMLTGALRHLFAVAENYPQLQAAQNFRDLQQELSDIEEKIAFARQFYNTNVLDYNNRLQTVPSNILAGVFNFGPEQFFEAEEEAREDVHVDFTPDQEPATPAQPAEPTQAGGQGQSPSS